MIGYLSGTVIKKDLRGVVIDVQGIGYKVTVLSDALTHIREGETLAVWTHLVVKEDALDLYGFRNEEELEFFKLLNTISGIGPKTALSILDLASIPSIRKAITSGDTSHLTKVSGIGTKIANKIVLELKGKLGAAEESPDFKEEVEALEALKALGYAHKDAREALKRVPENMKSTSDRIKEALKILGS